MEQDLVSFVLRFVREAGEEQQARWRGVVKHVQSNTEASFSQFSEALAFMQRYVNDIARSSFEETARMGEAFADQGSVGANPFAETARLWGEYMPRYTQMMVDSMNEAMATGLAMPAPVEEMMASTMSAWGMPNQTKQADQEKTAAALEAMAAQMASLNDKIASLETQLADRNKQSGKAK
ncbi:MAG: hypothetical protein ACK2UH_14210 [Candidatus Promineifilaceae bacterium]|jgi:hypothetical protein